MLRCRDQAGIDNLPRHGDVAGLADRSVKAEEQRPDRACLRQPFAEGPDGLGIRHLVGQAEPEEAHEGQSVLDQELGPLIRQRVAHLKDQDLEQRELARDF